MGSTVADVTSLEWALRFVDETWAPSMAHALEAFGAVTPVAIIFCRRHPTTGEPLPTLAPLVLHASECPTRESFYATARQLAAAGEALAAVVTAEAWTIVRPAESTYNYGDAESAGDRREIIAITLDHVDGMRWWEIGITRRADGTPCPGPVIGPRLAGFGGMSSILPRGPDA